MNKINIESYKEDIINDLRTLISYPSSLVEGEEGTPFGKANKECLEKALEIGKEYGFRVCNVDDYCGYIEMGQGEEVIGILGHLDIIPVSDSWNTNPFSLTINDDFLYGRGTSDDKGPVVCALTAMRMLKDLEPAFKKRVRLIMGCNEENGSKCVEHYVQKIGPVNCGFTPDGSFPLVFAEKGMVSALFTGKSEKIINFKGGTVRNAVAATCIIETIDDCYDSILLSEFFKENNIKFSLERNVLTVYGQAAHASTPDKGINAISYALEGLYHAGINDSFVNAYHNFIGLTCHGEKLKVNFIDDYSDLSFNIGVAYLKDGNLCCTIDIRFPVTLKPEAIINTLIDNSNSYIVDCQGVDPLYFPPDHPMIKALMKAYQDVTGDLISKPICMGGGTYAKEMPNIVAFGSDDGKFDYHIHDDNEFTTISSLLMQTECYYHAILNLLEI